MVWKCDLAFTNKKPSVRILGASCAVYPALFSLLILLVTQSLSWFAGFVRNLSWTFSNLCRIKNPPPDFGQLKRCLPTLTRFLNHHDPEVISDACWAFRWAVGRRRCRYFRSLKCWLMKKKRSVRWQLADSFSNLSVATFPTGPMTRSKRCLIKVGVLGEIRSDLVLFLRRPSVPHWSSIRLYSQALFRGWSNSSAMPLSCRRASGLS